MQHRAFILVRRKQCSAAIMSCHKIGMFDPVRMEAVRGKAGLQPDIVRGVVLIRIAAEASRPMPGLSRSLPQMLHRTQSLRAALPPARHLKEQLRGIHHCWLKTH